MPESWEWCTIDDIAESNIGLTYKPSDISNEGVPVYRSNNIQNRSICLDVVVRVETQILEKQYLHEGDLLICARNGSRNLVGKCALISNLSEPTSFGAFMAVCRSSYNKWIFLLLNSDYFDAYLDDSNSTAINQVTQKMLLAFQMPFPPANEQDRIYNEVCKWFSVIDSLEIEERDLKLSIEKAKSKILDLAIHGKLVPQDPNDEPAIEILKRINPKFTPCDNAHCPYDLPQNWEWTNLGEITNYGNCENVDVNDIPKEGWILELEDLEKDSAKIIQRLSKDERDIKGVRHSFHKDDVLYSKLRTYLNKVMVAPEAGFCTTEIIPVTCMSFIQPEYLNHVLRSKYFVDYTIQCGYGVKMPRLSTTDARNGQIPLPPYNEQLRIVAKIEELFSVLDEIQESIEA